MALDSRPDTGIGFGRLAAWAVSIGLLVLGMASLLGSASLLNPATNPISEAAPGFQQSMVVGTLVAIVLLVLSELVARRWSAPAGGWKWGWFLIGALFLIMGTPLLLGALMEDGTPLAKYTQHFVLGIGGLWVALGVAACAVPKARPRS